MKLSKSSCAISLQTAFLVKRKKNTLNLDQDSPIKCGISCLLVFYLAYIKAFHSYALTS